MATTLSTPSHPSCTDDEKRLSQTIAFLRFPLIAGVVLIHSRFQVVIIDGVDLMQEGHFPVYTHLSYLISEVIAEIAVPLFFFISGFLFFRRGGAFTGRMYVEKMKKRVRTLLVPYVFWNLVVIAFFFLAQTFLPDLMSGRSKLVGDYTVRDWLWAFWDTDKISVMDHKNYPACYQFWFIRNLMVVMLCSPLVYLAIRKGGVLIVSLLGLLWLANCRTGIVGVSIEAFFFFSAGAWFGIRQRNFIRVMQPLFPASLAVYAVLAALILGCREEAWCIYLQNIAIVIGLVSAVTLSAHCIRKGVWRANAFLSGSSFFIYAYHAIILAFLIKFCFKFFPPHSDAAILGLYALCPALIVGGGLLVYYLLKKYLPGFTGVITGGR